MGRLTEFFENDVGGLSMNRLILLGSFVVASLVMINLAGRGAMSEGYLTIYLTAFVASYAASRTGDYKTAIINRENHNAEPAEAAGK